MIKIRKIALGFLVLAFTTQSCEKELQDINTNPNQLNDTRPEFLFTSATQNYTLGRRDQLMNKYSTVMRYMQYIVGDNSSKEALESPYADPTKTVFPSPGGALYMDYYTSTGRDFHRIIEKINNIQDPALKNSYNNLAAVAKIMDTYDAWKVADIYGAMPYLEAFNAAKYPVPKYDYTWELYKVFDQQLKESVDVLKANTEGQLNFGKQDFFYNGDYAKWAKFANTLRIKIAQRFEKRDPAHLASVLSDIATNYDGQIISSNTDSFGYSNLQGWNNNIDDIDQIQNTYVAAYPFVEFLKSTDDPRLPLMVRKNDWGPNQPKYTTVKNNGTARAKATLDSTALNESRFVGKHVFSASIGGGYGWEGQPKTHQFTVQNASGTGTVTLNYISLIQTRLFVKNGGFKQGNPDLHTDETVVDGNTIPMRTSLLSYAETCFMMAEIAAKGGNGLGKSAEQWYNDGVIASFEHYKAMAMAQGVPGAGTVQFGDYLSRYPYAGLPSIYSQAWVNFLVQPDEAWAMWKRTGYPQFADFVPGESSRIGDGSGIAYLESLNTGTHTLLIPRRGVLPVSSQEISPNLDKAVQEMKAKDPSYGEDRLDTRGRIWWDVE